MRKLQTRQSALAKAIVAATFALLASTSMAMSEILWDTTISTVAVNGGVDSTNAGTSCIQVASSVSASCPSGFVAILNNNKQLIASALLNKATSGRVNLYYSDDSGSNHCPGFVFTPCVVISIQSK